MEFENERDGLELCAVAFSKACALYREADTEHYEVLMAEADTFEADTENGPRGYPAAPEKNRWNWISGKHPFADASKGAKGPPQSTAGASAHKDAHGAIKVSIPPSQRRLEKPKDPEEGGYERKNMCPTCKGKLMLRNHYHSRRDLAGLPVVVCCDCIIKEGRKCKIKSSD